MTDTKYVMVPVEPTDEMIIASDFVSWITARKVWADMLAAAPTQPSPAESDIEEIIETLGFEHSDRDGNMSGIQWKQFAIDLLSATPATKQGTVAEQFGSWWSSPDAPNGQHYEKDIAKQAWVASALYRYTPTQPAQPSDSRTEFSDTEILNWLFDQQESTNEKTVRENVIEAMRSDHE